MTVSWHQVQLVISFWGLNLFGFGEFSGPGSWSDPDVVRLRKFVVKLPKDKSESCCKAVSIPNLLDLKIVSLVGCVLIISTKIESSSCNTWINGKFVIFNRVGKQSILCSHSSTFLGYVWNYWSQNTSNFNKNKFEQF